MICGLAAGWWLSAGLCLCAAWLPTTSAQETDNEESVALLVPVAEIRDHVGEEVVTEFEVKASKFVKEKKICFLDSQQDHKSKENFAVIIKGDEALKRFAEAKIPDPAEHYRNKKIRVRGKVSLHRGQPQIVVESVAQIELLPAKPAVNTAVLP